MSDTTAAGTPTTSGDVRVLLVVAVPRTRMHIRRLLASAPNIDVIGHAQSAAQVTSLLQQGGVDLIIVNLPDDPAFLHAILDSARGAGIEVVVLADDSRLAGHGLGARLH